MRTAPKRSRDRIEIPEPVATNAPEPETSEIRAASEPGKPSVKAHGKVNGARPKAAPKMPMWDYLDSDERNADGTVTTIYRLEPVINKSHGQHYIARKPGRFNQEDLLQEFGSGVYDLYVKDANKALSYRDQLSIHHHAHPPKVDPEEIVASHPSNAVYLRTWGKKSANGDKPDKDTAGDLNTVLTTVLEKAGSFDPRLAELWQSTAQQRDELSKALAAQNAPPDLLALVKSIKDLLPSPSPAPSSDKSEILTLIAAMKDMQPRQQNPLELLQQARELFGPPAQPERNHIAELDQILSFAQKLAAIRGPVGERSAWDIGLDYVKELAPSLLQIVQNAMALRMQPRGAAQPAPGTPPPPVPVAFDPYANPQAAAAHARAMNAQAASAPSPQAGAQTSGAPTNGPQPTAAPPEGLAGASEILPLLTQFGGLIVNALNGGVPGHHFARNVAELVGVGTHAMIANHGEAALTANMMAVPDLGMFGEARLRKFAFEFVHYEELLEAEGDEEDEPESENAQRSRANR
jgi:hypothetical protein